MSPARIFLFIALTVVLLLAACQPIQPVTPTPGAEAEAVAAQPESAQSYFDKGVTAAEAGEYAQAVADFDEAIRLDPDLAPAYYYRGGAYMQVGNGPNATLSPGLARRTPS